MIKKVYNKEVCKHFSFLRKGYLCFVSLGLFFIMGHLQANSKIDSLELLLQNASSTLAKSELYVGLSAEYMYEGDYIKAKKYARIGYYLAKDDHNIQVVQQAVLSFGEILLYESDMDNFLPVNQLAYDISVLIDDSVGQMYSSANFGYYYYAIQDYSNALIYYNKAVEYLLTNYDLEFSSNLYNNLSVLHINLGNYGKALNYMNKAMKLYTELGDKEGIDVANISLASIYLSLREYEEAEKIVRKCINEKLEAHSLTDLEYFYSMMVGISCSTHEFKLMFYYAEKTREYAKSDLDPTMRVVYSILVDFYLEMYKTAKEETKSPFEGALLSKEFKSAIKGFDDASEKRRFWGNIRKMESISEKTEDLGLYLATVHKKGRYFFYEKKYHRAIDLYKESFNISDSLGLLGYKYENAENLSMTYRKLKDYRSAYYWEKISVAGNMSLVGEKLYEEIGQIQALNQFEQTKHSKKLLQREQEKEVKNLIRLEQDSISHEQRFQYMLLIGVGLLLGMIYLIFRKYKETLVQNVEVEQHMSELEGTVKKIQENIWKIEQSIDYASRIQNNLFFKNRSFEITLDSVLFYHPKEKVSGDFIWRFNEPNYELWLLADCTGHGVPGALMTIIGDGLLKAILKSGVRDAEEILKVLHERLKKRLHYIGSGKREAMDIGLCIKKGNEVSFVGAHHNLYHVRSGGIMQYKGARVSIGSSEVLKIKSYVINVIPGDTLYLATDGFADQKGGPEGKKFFYKPFRSLLEKISVLSPRKQEEALKEHFEHWRGRREQMDDVTVWGMIV